MRMGSSVDVLGIIATGEGTPEAATWGYRLMVFFSVTVACGFMSGRPQVVQISTNSRPPSRLLKHLTLSLEAHNALPDPLCHILGRFMTYASISVPSCRVSYPSTEQSCIKAAYIRCYSTLCLIAHPRLSDELRQRHPPRGHNAADAWDAPGPELFPLAQDISYRPIPLLPFISLEGSGLGEGHAIKTDH